MKGILHVIDVSPHIYAGSVNKKAVLEGPLRKGAKGWDQLSVPAGGISFLFNKVYKYLQKDTIVFCFDRSPINRLKILDTYKQGRSTPEDITTQKRVAEQILIDCGYHVFAADDYEADDLIYSIVHDNKENYDHIYVHTGDSDMYSLVCDNVSILPSSSRAKTVTKENYEFTVDSKKIVKYNTLNMLKMIEGDTTDKIPPVRDGTAKVFREFMDNDSFPGEMLADVDLVGGVAKDIGGDVYRNFLLVYPWYYPDLIIDEFKSPDIMRVQAWGKMMGNANFKNARVNLAPVKEIVSKYFEEGEELQ